MQLNTRKFSEKEALNATFAGEIVAILNAAIAERGSASIAVSGGSTPKPLFQALSQNTELDWSKVTVMLVDERWVDESSEASNTALVKQHLLTGVATSATFLSIKTNHETPEQACESIETLLSSVMPLDIVILGMGEDAHTASLFPCCEQLDAGLDLDSPRSVIATHPTTAPHARISFTLKTIIKARCVFLHITGDKKLQVLDEALSSTRPSIAPIKAVADNCELTLMWAP